MLVVGDQSTFTRCASKVVRIRKRDILSSKHKKVFKAKPKAKTSTFKMAQRSSNSPRINYQPLASRHLGRELPLSLPPTFHLSKRTLCSLTCNRVVRPGSASVSCKNDRVYCQQVQAASVRTRALLVSLFEDFGKLGKGHLSSESS